ncbi:MAG: deaminase [Lentisphaerota bacterium]
MTWDQYFMDMCDLVATKSKDTSTKVGAVIVGRERQDVRSTGFNGFPRGIFDDVSEVEKLGTEAEYGIIFTGPEYLKQVRKLKTRLERPLKYMLSEHAERNAVYAAAAVGVPLAGCMLYVNSLPPCHDCARAIIQTGIKEIIHAEGEVPERWKESCGVGREMLEEAGVLIRTVVRNK